MQKQLHPGARWLFRIRGFFGVLFLMIFAGWFLGFFLVGMIGALMGTSAGGVVVIGIILFIFFLIIAIVLIEVYARMAYNRFFYEFTDTNLKVERGIIWKKYSNIPYERVQNVDIQRGIIARIFGFSSVNIQTAGYSYTPKGMPSSEGYLPAVDMNEAEQIREFLMKKITKNSRSGGL